MSTLLSFTSLAPKTKSLVVAGGLISFVFGVYFYTMRAVGGTDELQTAIDKFEETKSKNKTESSLPSRFHIISGSAAKHHLGDALKTKATFGEYVSGTVTYFGICSKRVDCEVIGKLAKGRGGEMHACPPAKDIFVNVPNERMSASLAPC